MHVHVVWFNCWVLLIGAPGLTMQLIVYISSHLINVPGIIFLFIIDKKQTISFGPNHHYVANGSQLILNCTSWNDNLSSYNLCWRFENKAWLNDHTTRLDARTVQLYNPNVTYDNNGTYQCCLCNATLLSGVVECNQTDVVFIGGMRAECYILILKNSMQKLSK